MNPSSSSMAPVLVDYHKKSANLRSQILKNEEQRIQLEQKLRSLSTVDSRLKQKQQIENVQSFFTQFNQESQRAEQRNLQLLNDITQAERNLDQLRIDTEHLIRLKHDYLQYLESNYPDWQKRVPTGTDTNLNTYDFNRSPQKQNVSAIVDSSILSKRHDDHTNSNEIKDQQHDEQSLSESTSNAFSRSKRAGSLRMELNLPANDQQKFAIKDLEPTTTSMVILDQLPSTIRRTTIHKCLLTEDILSSNVIDLDKDTITKMLPEQDRLLWIRLIDHFTCLLKYHIMNSETLANKFAPTLLPNNIFYLHDKAKSLLKHIVEKFIGTQQLSSDDEISTDRKQLTKPLSSSWLNKLKSTGGIDDDMSSSSSSSSSLTTTRKSIKSPSSTATTPRGYIHQNDSDLEFYN